MRHIKSRTRFGTCLTIALAIIVGLSASGGITFASVPGQASSGQHPAAQKTIGTIAHVQAPPAGSNNRPVTAHPYAGHADKIDLDKLGIRPLPITGGGIPGQPTEGLVGTSNAYVDLEPSVVRPNQNAVVASSGWTPGETVDVFFNENLSYTTAAAANGRIVFFTATSAPGYYVMTIRGRTSGKQAGGTLAVNNAATIASALTIAPHAINPNGTNTFTLYGTGFPPNTPIRLDRNGVYITFINSDSNGQVLYDVTPGAGGDNGAVYTAADATGTTMAGKSVEERADAGSGDLNQVRGFAARAITNNHSMALAFEGEGFVPGELVYLAQGSTGYQSANADSNGAVIFFSPIVGSIAGSFYLYGSISSRIAWVAARADSVAPLVPSLIVTPQQVWGDGGLSAWYTQFMPNQSATMYLDGVSLGSAGVGSDGNGYGYPPKPSSGFVHYVTLVAANGQIAVGSFISLVNAASPTATATTTSTSTRTSTPTPTFTPTFTPTRTPTSSVTATPTNTPVLLTIVGHANWQGRGTQPDARQMMPISLTLQSTTGGPFTDSPWQVTDSSGHFTFTTTLSPGNYNWRVRGPAYLANSGTSTLTAGINNLEVGLLKGGDLDGNNVVNITDFNLFKGNFGQAGAPPLAP